MIWFVHRRENGTIQSAHEGVLDENGTVVSPMPDYCSEGLDDATNAEIQAYRLVVTARTAPQ